ncbi:MAG: PCP degradation transcriptional activation protein [Paracidovorax wautersii]|uniref:PCP degradation transcriptional activation protein n=1 Tax=Paracidovorax wautersii TaxID=1177982 RepID=A0A7V8FRE9_9BURK|nr:MAG: PCP degradation transcriptional activation protein [Paracidovorax wautersii]
MVQDLRDIDLNLLVVFHEVMATGGISPAARRLGLSQPAASNALARLRQSLGDELFVRAGARMQPTALAVQLAGPVEAALALLQDGLRYRAAFDPATDTRHFRVAMTDVGEVYFLPRLLPLLQARAPGVRLHAVQATGAALKAGLQDGSIDLALGPFEDMPASFFQQRLFRQSCVCLFNQAHAFAQTPPRTLAAYRQARHLSVANAASPYVEIQARMEKAGIAMARHDQVSSFLTAPFVVATSDCVVTVPLKLAEHFADSLALRWIEPPRLPTLATHCFWHQRVHQDAGHARLRGLIAERFADAPVSPRAS